MNLAVVTFIFLMLNVAQIRSFGATQKLIFHAFLPIAALKLCLFFLTLDLALFNHFSQFTSLFQNSLAIISILVTSATDHSRTRPP